MHKSPAHVHEFAARLRFAGTYEAPQKRDYPAHAHPVWEVIYYLTGHIRCVVEGRPFLSEPGMLLAIPPGAVHHDEALTGYSQIVLAIEAPAEQPWGAVAYDDPERSCASLCRSLEREWRGAGEYRDEMLTLLVGQLDLRLRRAQRQDRQQAAEAGRDPWEEAILSAEAILQARYASPLTVEEVAREIGMSASRLRVHFARLRGRTPQATLHEIRLRQAVYMLRNSSLTLETIAALCGYYSASHLSRYVRRETGRSPGQIRRCGIASETPPTS